LFLACKTQLVGIAPARIDRPAFCIIEGEKHLHFKVADIPGQLSHAQKR